MQKKSHNEKTSTNLREQINKEMKKKHSGGARMRPDLAKVGDTPCQKIASRSWNRVHMNRAWGNVIAATNLKI